MKKKLASKFQEDNGRILDLQGNRILLFRRGNRGVRGDLVGLVSAEGLNSPVALLADPGEQVWPQRLGLWALRGGMGLQERDLGSKLLQAWDSSSLGWLRRRGGPQQGGVGPVHSLLG